MNSNSSNMWQPAESRWVKESEGQDDATMIQAASDFYKLSSVQIPFQERSEYSSTCKTSVYSGKSTNYNANVVYTTRPVFKYTAGFPKTSEVSKPRKHYKELWRNSAPLEQDTPLESFTVGKYYRNTKLGKSAVSVREVDGRFIPTPPSGSGAGPSAITQWSRWFDYF